MGDLHNIEVQSLKWKMEVGAKRNTPSNKKLFLALIIVSGIKFTSKLGKHTQVHATRCFIKSLSKLRKEYSD